MIVGSDAGVARPPTAWKAAALAAAGVAALAAFAAHHVTGTGFWYDETMQFWMSLGIDGFSHPHTPPAGLADMVHVNATGNLDPGGFTLILHYWLKISTDPVWLRILPVLFFALGAAGLGWIGWTQRRSLVFAALCCGVPAMFPLLMNYASEVRAYSMEFAGVVIGCAMLERVAARRTVGAAVLAGVVVGLFLSSRYGYALFAVAACLSVTACALRDRRGDSLRRRLAALLAFLVPVGCAGMVVVLLALWPQYHARIAYNGGVLIGYLVPMTTAAKTYRQIAEDAVVNLLHPAGLPVTVGAALGLIALLPPGVRRRLRLAGAASQLEDAGLAPFGLLCLAALMVTALLWRWHPWAITMKWSSWLQALAAVAVVRLTAATLARAGAGAVDDSARESSAPLAALMLVAILALDLRLALYRRPAGPSFVPALTYLEGLAPPPGAVAMDVYSYPTVRYFYEYGPFAASRLYPDSYRMPYWDGPQPLIGPQTRLVLSVLPLDAANKMFAPVRLTRDPGLPDRLYRVEAATAGSSHDAHCGDGCGVGP